MGGRASAVSDCEAHRASFNRDYGSQKQMSAVAPLYLPFFPMAIKKKTDQRPEHYSGSTADLAKSTASHSFWCQQLPLINAAGETLLLHFNAFPCAPRKCRTRADSGIEVIRPPQSIWHITKETKLH